MPIRQKICVVLVFVLVFTVWPNPGAAFYEWQNGAYSGDIRALVRGFGIVTHYPEQNDFIQDQTDSGLAGIGRLITQAAWGKHLWLDMNVYQTYIPVDLLSGQGHLGAPLNVERSSVLELSFSNDQYIHLAFDQLHLRITFDWLDVKVGRQPINLATNFYFTPNDFFSPFSAQVFYRVYKPGVDAARAEIRLGPLSQLSLISVLGYGRDPDSDTGWQDAPDSRRASHLGRLSTVWRDTEWALLIGEVRDENIIGGSVQGDVLNWLGFRAEGHVADPKESGQADHAEWSLGVDHRWENSLDVRLAFFYHGRGTGKVSDYDVSSASDVNPYLARRYLAFGGGYEFTPLLRGDALALVNLVDHSFFMALNTVYSLSDEAELVLNAALPFGQRPAGDVIESEFGLAPFTFNLEIRSYF